MADLVDGYTQVGGLQLAPTDSIFTKLKVYTATLSPAEVAANTSAEQALTVTGLAVGDVILSVNKPTAQAGLGIVGWRTAGANSLGLTFMNDTGTPITPTASEVYSVVACATYIN